MDHLDFANEKNSKRTEFALSAVSGKTFSDVTALTILQPKRPVSLPVVSINLPPRRLGHPNETLLRKIMDIVESDVKFSDSLKNCSACKMGKRFSEITSQKGKS